MLHRVALCFTVFHSVAQCVHCVSLFFTVSDPGSPQENTILENKLFRFFPPRLPGVPVCGGVSLFVHLEAPLGLPICPKKGNKACSNPPKLIFIAVAVLLR